MWESDGVCRAAKGKNRGDWEEPVHRRVPGAVYCSGRGFKPRPACKQIGPGSIEFRAVALRSNRWPRKTRDLLMDLRGAVLKDIPCAGKEGNRKLVYPKFPGADTVSGKLGDDVKLYQEREVTTAIGAITK